MKKNKVTSIVDGQLDAAIRQGKVVLDFWADWCGPCKQLAPVLDELAISYPNVKFLKLDVNANSEAPAMFNVRSLPTLIFFNNGEVVGQRVGAVSKADIQRELETA